MDFRSLGADVRKLYRRFSKLMIIASVCGGIVASSFVLLGAGGQGGTMQMRTLILGIILLLSAGTGIVTYFTAVVISWILLYRAWQSVQNANPWTTPGKAVGFCFIPIFQNFWVFVAIYGLARTMNRLKRQMGLPLSKWMEILALALCLCPFVGSFIWIGMAETMERNDAALFAVPAVLFLIPTILHWIIIAHFSRTAISFYESPMSSG